MKVSEMEGEKKQPVLAGNRYSSLLVIVRSGTSSDGRVLWSCRCDCGTVIDVSTKALRGALTKSCISCAPQSSRSPLEVRLAKWKLSDSGCWEWTGRVNEHGYGRIIVDGRETRAHRAMFFMLNPASDRSLVVMHSCDNPCCINPRHLSLGTVLDNVMDMHQKKRFKGGAKKGNKNALGNIGWTKGGIIKQLGRVPSRFGQEVSEEQS